MAASSVEFYQKQKELQDSINRSAEERQRLENQLKAYFQSDNRVAKLKAVRLNNYWKKICDDEKRSKERNEHLLREFERIDCHLVSMSTRTEKLRFLKKQYEETIERKYPNWRELVKPTVNQKPEQVKPTDNQKPEQVKPTDNQKPEQVKPTDNQKPEQVKPTDNQKPEQVKPTNNQKPEQVKPTVNQTPNITQAPLINKATPQRSIHQESHPTDISTPIKPTLQPPTTSTQNYQRPETQHITPNLQKKSEVISIQAESCLQPDTGAKDGSIPDIQPVQNVTMQAIRPIPTSGPMDPADESEIDSDLDLPLSGQTSPKKKSSENPGLQGTTEAVASIETEVVSTSARSSGTGIRAELTLTGIVYLLKYVQDDIKDAVNTEGYYRMTHPDSSQRSNILHKANNGKNLAGINANLISMVILEQLTLVVRNLVNFGLIRDEMLTSDTTRLTGEDIGSTLPSDACDLWDSLFHHFTLLVQFKVMEPKEVAAIFVPGLVADGSQYQQKAFSLLVRLLEKFHNEDLTDESSCALPRHQAPVQAPVKHTPRSNNNSLTDPNKVPRLMFGSLVDKPFSDDESSIFSGTFSHDQSAVPLNETDAYKNMLSGTRSISHHQKDEEEDTDDDVEKQFASVLSPQGVLSPRLKKDTSLFSPKSGSGLLSSARSSKGSTIGSTGSYQAPRRTVLKIGSDLDSDTEIDFKPKTNKQTEEDDDFEFYN